MAVNSWLFLVAERQLQRLKQRVRQIIQHVMAFLGKAGELSGQDAADSLMALAYLREISTEELLQLFLEKRLDWVKALQNEAGK